jgi:hypothetical protein
MYIYRVQRRRAAKYLPAVDVCVCRGEQRYAGTKHKREKYLASGTFPDRLDARSFLRAGRYFARRGSCSVALDTMPHPPNRTRVSWGGESIALPNPLGACEFRTSSIVGEGGEVHGFAGAQTNIFLCSREFKNHDCFALIHSTLAYLLILSALRVMLDGLVWF